MIVVNKFKTALFRFFERAFSFEHDIDLNDEVEVLFRRNIVIKNIIFVANLVYTLILFIISIGDPSNGNWLWSVIPLPFTFVINYTINKIIKSSVTARNNYFVLGIDLRQKAGVTANVGNVTFYEVSAKKMSPKFRELLVGMTVTCQGIIEYIGFHGLSLLLSCENFLTLLF